jgi:RNase P subunit RPR2
MAGEGAGVPCPNCGSQMVPLRRDISRLGDRDIELIWVICVNCRHTRLDDWHVVEDQRSHLQAGM